MNEEFQKGIYWGWITALAIVIMLIWAIGGRVVRERTIRDVFGDDYAHTYLVKERIAKEIPKLFDARFYLLNENSQIHEASKFWEKSIYPIARQLPPSEMADLKDDLFQSIHRMNRSTSSVEGQLSPKLAFPYKEN